MKNITMKTKGSVLTITIDLDENFGPSKSGKTEVIASTLGNKQIDGHEGTFVGVNCYCYPDQGSTTKKKTTKVKKKKKKS